MFNLNRDASKMNKNFLKLVVLCIGMQDMAVAAAMPAIAPMIEAFPNVSPPTIQTILTLPNLLVVIFSPMYAWLCTIVKVRKIILFAMTCFIVGGVFPVFLEHHLLLIAISRVFVGIGAGLLIPGAIALITVYYEGQERDTMIGWHMSISNIAGIFMQLLGGYLAVIHWKYCFFAYIFPIWALTLAALKLPDPPQVFRSELAENEKQGFLFARLNKHTYGVIVLYFLITVLVVALPTNISVMLVNDGIGNPGNAGVTLSMFTVGAFFAGLIFGKIKKLAKGYILALGWLILGIGYTMISLSYNLPGVYGATLFAGFGLGIMVPGYYAKVSEVAPPLHISLGVAMNSAAQGMANFLQPAIFAVILSIFNQPIGRFSMYISCICLIIGAVTIAIVQSILGHRPNRAHN